MLQKNKFVKFKRSELLHIILVVKRLHAKDAGKYPHVTPRSAIASDKTNQLAVVCSLLVFVIRKITQLFPTRPKTVTNHPTIQYQ